MKDQFSNMAQLWSALIIDQFTKNGVKDYFPSPGMRNAPLLKAIKLNPLCEVYLGVDERSQAYRALAHIKLSKRPAVLICTSGTAIANYLPAIIEARKTHLPLFVLSADRPGELLAVDANQTINQVEVLRNYTKSFWQASEPQENFPPRALAGKLSFIIQDAFKDPMGPMHINIPLREPLDETIEDISQSWSDQVKTILEEPLPSLKLPKIQKNIESVLIKSLIEKLQSAKKPLILFGAMDSWADQERRDVKKFIKAYGGNFSCDITSGLKFAFGSKDGLIPSLDHPEVLLQLEKIKPDFIIHFGHRLTSKHYYNFLANSLERQPNLEILQVCDGHYHEDPGFSFTQRWNISPQNVFSQLIKHLEEMPQKPFSKRDFFDWSLLINKKRQIIEEGPLSYPLITKRAIESLPTVKNAFIGNSTYIRSFDSYAAMEGGKNNWRIITTRGASGIEGHLSLALGIAERASETSLAFIGDVSFIHDLGTLLKIQEVSKQKELPLLIIIANNHGGGIFKLLPIAKSPVPAPHLDYLTTPHKHDLLPIAESVGIEGERVMDKQSYFKALEDWSKTPRLKILEVILTDEDNTKLYDQLKTVKL